jgi:hypothetical protein
MAIIASDTPITWDSFQFDARPFDTVADTFVTFTTELPPVPASVGPLTTYDAFDTPLYAIGQIHRIDLVFTVTASNQAIIEAMPAPTVYIWLPNWTAPAQAQVVEKVSTGKYSVYVPYTTEVKLYIV